MSILKELADKLSQGLSQLPLPEIHNFNQNARDTWVKSKAGTIPPGSKVLDIGAGTCPYRVLFAHCDYKTHDFKKYEGVKLGGSSDYGKIDYESDINHIPVPDSSFDVILCTEVLEHAPEPIEALREMSRILKPAGMLLLTAPLGSGLHQLPYHYYGGFTPEWYKLYCGKFRLDVLEIVPNGGFFKLLAQECARVAWSLPQHQHLHGNNVEYIKNLFGEWLPRYLFALEDKLFINQFTVGYHIEAKKIATKNDTKNIPMTITPQRTTSQRYPLADTPAQTLTGVVFSKDRAMQLECVLRSFWQHCKDPNNIDLKVLYTTSDARHEKQYLQLKGKHPSVKFIRETAFKENTESAVSSSEHALFLVDDNIFMRDFAINHIVDSLKKNPDAIGFSLRLGKNTTYCYMLNQPQTLPEFQSIEQGILKYNWTTAEYDFRYPLELSSSIYRIADILPLLQQIDFRNPNTLEALMDANKTMFAANRAALLCYESSVTFGNPINKVQTVFDNKSGVNSDYSAEQLANWFEKGLRVDLKPFEDFTPYSCHQEVALQFTKGIGSSDNALPLPAFSENEFQSQHLQDKYLDTVIFHGMSGGVFLDIGAHDGVYYSNTYFLEKNRNWTGICVEPNPDIIERLKKNRSCITIQGCISNENHIAKFLKVNGYPEMLSGILEKCDTEHLARVDREIDQYWGSKEIIDVHCYRVTDLLKQHNISHIDYCSIDVEGAELEVLQSIDFTAVDIDVLTIENENCNKNIREFMKIAGYELIQRLGCNDIFGKKGKFIRGIESQKRLSASVSPVASQRSSERIPKVSIIILNFNGMVCLAPCLESLQRHTPEPHEIIVFDNASTDGSQAYLRSRTDIILIESKENLGCPPARAKALALAESDYVVLLDNDTIVTPRWLMTFIEHAKANPSIGIMGPRSNYVSGPQIVLNAPYKNLHGLDAFAMQFSAQHRGHLTLTHRLVGFCMFIRREVIDKIGSIDASFGKFGFEDDDYTWRAQIAGFSAAIANDVFIHHAGGPQGRGSKQYNRLLLEAWQIFKQKWDLPVGLQYGSPFDVGNIVQRQFDPKRDYIQLVPRTSVEPLIYAYGKQASSGGNSKAVAQYEQLKTKIGDGNEEAKISVSKDIAYSKIQFKRKAKSDMVSIIIPVSRHSKQLKKCIENLKQNTPETHEIIFVENGCKAGMLKWIRQTVKRKSNYRLIKAGKEAGQGECFNMGMEPSSGEYIVLLYKHVMVTDGWLNGMLRCINRADNVGVVGPMTSGKAAGTQCVADSGHVKIDQLERYAGAFLERNRHRRVASREVASFCMLFRRSLVEHIGPFDEELEQNSESDDYCLRAAIEGYQNHIAGDVFVLCGDLPPKGNKRFFGYKWRDIDAKSHDGERLGVINAITDAEDLYQREEVDKAIVKLIDGIKYRPDKEGIYHRLVEMLIDCERFSEGIDAINSIPEDKRDNARTLELTGCCKAGLDLYDEAAQFAGHALSLNGSSSPALNLMGVLAHEKGDKNASEDFFKRAIASDPGYGEAYTNLGILEWEAGSKEEALEILEKGFILSPTAEDSRTAYLSAISETAEFERAEGIFCEAKGLYPQNRRIAFLLIDILIRQEKYESAIQDIRNAMITFGIDDGILAAAQAVIDRLDVQEKKNIERKPALSLCMIVKDEENCLAKCLMSAMPVVDEIVIVDTGSTDRTKAIAKVFGARVYDFEWTSDFSEARNLSLAKATGDWILVLDADEVISPLDYEHLIKIVKNKAEHPKAYSITTRNYVKPTYVIGWICNNGEYADEEEGTGWYPSLKVRLFPNDSHIRFENPVHEFVEVSLKKIGIKIIKSDIPVHHYGQIDREHYVAKGEKYYLLGKKKLEEKGEDLKSLSELAVQAGGEFGKYEEAVDLWKRVLKIDPHNTKALVNMGGSLLKLEKYEAARTSSKMAMTLEPDLKEAVIIYTTCEVLIGDVGKTVPILENLLKKVPEYPLAFAILSAAYGIEGESKKGMEQIRNITRMGFKVADYLHDMAERLISTGQTDRAVSLLEFAIESGKGTRAIRELLNDSLREG